MNKSKELTYEYKTWKQPLYVKKKIDSNKILLDKLNEVLGFKIVVKDDDMSLSGNRFKGKIIDFLISKGGEQISLLKKRIRDDISKKILEICS